AEGGRGRPEDLHTRPGPAGPHRDRPHTALALERRVRRECARDTPVARAEGAPAYQAEDQRNHRHDELRPPREDTEDEPAGGERHHRKSERRHAGRHPSAFATPTSVST